MQIVTDGTQKELKEHGSYEFPLLFSEERLSGYETGSFLWHWHPEIELTVIEEGRMIYRVNQETFSLKKGDVLFQNTGVLHSGRMEQGCDCSYLSITFDPKLIYGFENSLIYRKYVEPLTHDFAMPAILLDGSQDWHEEGFALLREMAAVKRNEEEAAEMEQICGLQRFWKLLFIHRPPVRTPDWQDGVNYERIRKMLTYMEHNFDRDIRLEDMAAQVHLCKSECSRIFKRYMKVPLFSFLTDYRIERSREFLADPECSVKEAAAKAGFPDPDYFSRIFSRKTGIPPSVYKKRGMTAQQNSFPMRL